MQAFAHVALDDVRHEWHHVNIVSAVPDWYVIEKIFKVKNKNLKGIKILKLLTELNLVLILMNMVPPLDSFRPLEA